MSSAPTDAERAAARKAALARAAEAGIHCLPIPTPFAVGRVNTYLIEDDPLTLVDSGPNSGKALDALEQALAARGYRVDDLELLVITHQHMDHLGLTDILARRSGAEVAALDLLAPYAARFREDAERDDVFAEAVMLRHGIPEDVVYALRAVSSAYRAWGASVQVTRRLHDGGRLELRDRTLDVMHRPGHSPTDTVFWDAERRILIAADHLIKHISSNPLITRPVVETGENGSHPATDDAGAVAPGDGSGSENGSAVADPAARPQALVTYIASMRATAELPAELVLAGHGDPITDHVALIDERLRMHERRARKILRMIEQEPRTAHEIAHALWGNVAVTQAYLTLSEVLGHVDILLNEGRVVELESDGVVHFRAAT